MSGPFVPTLILLATFVSLADFQPVEHPSYSQLASMALRTGKANVKFTADLLRQLASTDYGKNVIFSPFSISVALAMTSVGAEGKTLKEIDDACYFNEVNTKEEPHAIHQAYRYELTQKYKSYNPAVELNIANRLYAKNGFRIKDEFLFPLNAFYDGGFEQVDFTSGKTEGIINKWVEDNTQNKITNLFKPRSFNSDTALVIVNAIYFKGSWRTQFERSNGRKRRFHGPDHRRKLVDMMSVVDDFEYFYDEIQNAKILSLPYSGNTTKMIIVLPDDPYGLVGLLKNMNLSEILSSPTKDTRVKVEIPKFKIEESYELNDVLQRIGIREAFSGQSNFSRISDVPLYVSKVVHKALVEVNEHGTVAAAATGVQTDIRSATYNGPVPFIADHPFFFAIVDNLYGTVFFSGVVNSP